MSKSLKVMSVAGLPSVCVLGLAVTAYAQGRYPPPPAPFPADPRPMPSPLSTPIPTPMPRPVTDYQPYGSPR
jgi:hypothetical protein